MDLLEQLRTMPPEKQAQVLAGLKARDPERFEEVKAMITAPGPLTLGEGAAFAGTAAIKGLDYVPGVTRTAIAVGLDKALAAGLNEPEYLPKGALFEAFKGNPTSGKDILEKVGQFEPGLRTKVGGLALESLADPGTLAMPLLRTVPGAGSKLARVLQNPVPAMGLGGELVAGTGEGIYRSGMRYMDAPIVAENAVRSAEDMLPLPSSILMKEGVAGGYEGGDLARKVGKVVEGKKAKRAGLLSQAAGSGKVAVDETAELPLRKLEADLMEAYRLTRREEYLSQAQEVADEITRMRSVLESEGANLATLEGARAAQARRVKEARSAPMAGGSVRDQDIANAARYGYGQAVKKEVGRSLGEDAANAYARLGGEMESLIGAQELAATKAAQETRRGPVGQPSAAVFASGAQKLISGEPSDAAAQLGWWAAKAAQAPEVTTRLGLGLNRLAGSAPAQAGQLVLDQMTKRAIWNAYQNMQEKNNGR